MTTETINALIASSPIQGRLKQFEWSDESDQYTTRLHIHVNKDYSISIIRGDYSYGGRDGLFEMAVMGRKEGLIRMPFYASDDCVQGYLTPSALFEMIEKTLDWIDKK